MRSRADSHAPASRMRHLRQDFTVEVQALALPATVLFLRRHISGSANLWPIPHRVSYVSRHHVIISGTGRAGTTFLVQLLTALGLDTGFSTPDAKVYANCRAGMEQDLRNPRAPLIVKNPWLCDYLDEVLQDPQIVIDHAFIPVRGLFAAAESRRHVAANSDPDPETGDIPGGLWHTDSPPEQETVLARQLYKLIHTLAKRDIPATLLYFPRLAQDPEYLFRKLSFLCGEIGYEQFLQAFHHTVQPDWIHHFET